jgi:broad specificity phosphatase PhoE
MQGQFESKLNALGHKQAARSGETLARLGVDHVFASPLLRVRQTLAEIAPFVSLAPVFDDRLKEWSSGEWSGFLYADIAKKWPEAFAAWDADRYGVRSPGGENFVDLSARAESFFTEFADADWGRSPSTHRHRRARLHQSGAGGAPDGNAARRHDGDPAGQ